MKIVSKLKRIRDGVIAIESYTPISIDENTEYIIDIKENRKGRSNRQNAYLWELITEIVKAQNGGRSTEEMRIDLYTHFLEKAGAKSFYVEISKDDYLRFTRMVRAHKIVGYNDYMQMYEIIAYIGSSQFDTKEMSNFIDYVLDYASECGIYTDYWKELLYEE